MFPIRATARVAPTMYEAYNRHMLLGATLARSPWKGNWLGRPGKVTGSPDGLARTSKQLLLLFHYSAFRINANPSYRRKFIRFSSQNRLSDLPYLGIRESDISRICVAFGEDTDFTGSIGAV